MFNSRFVFYLLLCSFSLIFLSCKDQGGSGLPYIPRPNTSAEDNEKLRRQYEQVCHNLNFNCANDKPEFCKNFKDLINLTYCHQPAGTRVGAGSSCKCSDVCKPDKLNQIAVKDAESALEELRYFDKNNNVHPNIAYAQLKTLAPRVSFPKEVDKNVTKAEAKIDALKVIDSLESGSYVGELKSFNSIATMLKFIKSDPVLKDRFLTKMKSAPQARVKSTDEFPRNLKRLSEGDYFSSSETGKRYMIGIKDKEKCLKELPEGECIPRVWRRLPKDAKKLVVSYDKELLTKVHSSCVIDTQCSDPPKHLVPKKMKARFVINEPMKTPLRDSYKQQLPKAIDCTEKIGASKEFREGLISQFGKTKGEDYFQQISTTDRTINVTGYHNRFRTVNAMTEPGTKPTVINLNNNAQKRSNEGMVGTLMHEYFHLLGHYHKSSTPDYGDDIYIVGQIAERASKSLCEL